MFQVICICCFTGGQRPQGAPRTAWKPRERWGKWNRWSAWISWFSWITGGHILFVNCETVHRKIHAKHDLRLQDKIRSSSAQIFLLCEISTSGSMGIQGRARTQRGERWRGENKTWQLLSEEKKMDQMALIFSCSVFCSISLLFSFLLVLSYILLLVLSLQLILN